MSETSEKPELTTEAAEEIAESAAEAEAQLEDAEKNLNSPDEAVGTL